MGYYNGRELLEQKDINGKNPSIFVSTTNRSAGKTTYFIDMMAEKAVEDNKEFVLFFRSKDELPACSLIVESVTEMTGRKYEIKAGKKIGDNMVHTIYINGELKGYGIYLGHYVKLKKYSPLFSRVEYTLMDEYQPEDGKFLKNEVTAYMSLIYSISRGNGKQFRYVKNILAGNLITLMNPYLIKSKLYKHIYIRENETNYFKTKGWVAEVGYNKDASQALKDSSFADAFENEGYIKNNLEASYLFDASRFIGKIKSRKQRYIVTLRYNGCDYGVRADESSGNIYISSKHDPNCKTVIIFKESEHTENTIHFEFCTEIIMHLTDCYYNARMYFDSLETKNTMFEILSLSIYR